MDIFVASVSIVSWKKPCALGCLVATNLLAVGCFLAGFMRGALCQGGQQKRRVLMKVEKCQHSDVMRRLSSLGRIPTTTSYVTGELKDLSKSEMSLDPSVWRSVRLHQIITRLRQ